MVIIGGVLEDHMRKLCVSRSLSWTGNGSISKYNDCLRDALYAQTTWRRIQAIGDVRNDSAHGHGADVKQREVGDAQQYVRRFIADYPS